MAAAGQPGRTGGGGIPWYKEKYPRSKYLVKGDPFVSQLSLIKYRLS